MSELKYQLPDSNKFLTALGVILRQQGFSELASLLSDSKLSFTTTQTWSRYMGGTIWNAYGTIASFAIAPEKFEIVSQKIGEAEKRTIVLACCEIMPQDSGYEITEARLSISLEDTPRKQGSIEDINSIISQLPITVKDVAIPQDIIDKAKKMSEVYIYTYCAENALRAFIDAVAQKNYGKDYMTKLKMNGDMNKKIKERKGLQAKKKWLSARGNSDIFYLDIDNLATLIGGNWEIFKQYFDRLDWITVNISEIGDCRNQVAHHSYLEEHEQQIIRTDFIKILKQISDTYK